MSQAGTCSILLLTGRVAGPEAADRVAGLAGRAEAEGFRPVVLCSSGAALLADRDCEVEESEWVESPWVLRALARWLLPALAADPPRLIHVLEPELAEAGRVLGRLWRVPILISVDEFGRLPRGLAGGTVASAQLLLAASAAIQEEARGVLKERAGMVRVVPFGIEMPRRVEGGYSSRGEGRVPVVGAAGTWEPGDGVGTLLEATARLVESGKDLELLLAGEGPDENRHRDRAEELGIVERVTFTREPSLADPFWDVISIYCQPSTRQTTGRYLAAALCAGLPCLASRVKDLDRLLQGGRFGGLLPAGDAEALADAIGGAILEPGQLAGRAAEGSAWARHEFDPEDSFAILKDAYEEALDPSRTPWPAGRGGGLESGDLRAD